MSLDDCKTVCGTLMASCYGIEYYQGGRCEIWKVPIGRAATVGGNYECFQNNDQSPDAEDGSLNLQFQLKLENASSSFFPTLIANASLLADLYDKVKSGMNGVMSKSKWTFTADDVSVMQVEDDPPLLNITISPSKGVLQLYAYLRKSDGDFMDGTEEGGRASVESSVKTLLESAPWYADFSGNQTVTPSIMNRMLVAASTSTAPSPTPPNDVKEHLGQLNSTLELYTSQSFAAVFKVGSAVYKEGERLYAQHSLNAMGEGLELKVSSLWLSNSPDRVAPVLESLTSNVAEEDNSKDGIVRFSAKLVGTCDACYIHVVSTISVRSDQGRRLTEAVLWPAHGSILLSVLAAEPAEPDADLLPALVIGVEAVLLVSVAIAVVLGLLTRALLCKFAPAREGMQYSHFFAFEFADVVLDVAAYALCRGAGDLEFSNDTAGAISAVLLASVILSVSLCAMEAALCLIRPVYFDKLFMWLLCGHLISEDFFQCALYSMIAASQAVAGTGYELSVVFGIIQSALFVGLKTWEIVRAASRG